MSAFNIEVAGGTSVRLPTAGKYCDRDIVITATGGGGGGDELTQLLTNKLTALKSNATKVKQYTMRNATALTSVDLPQATTIEAYAFYNCSKLTSVNLPKVTSAGSYSFGGCAILESISLPSLTSGAENMFRYDYKLLTVDLPKVNNIVANMFNNCTRMTALILRSETLCPLANTSAFTSCYHFLGTVSSTYNPNGDRDGYIYVPAALVDSYKVASRWTNFADQFRAIEDYPDICG